MLVPLHKKSFENRCLLLIYMIFKSRSWKSCIQCASLHWVNTRFYEVRNTGLHNTNLTSVLVTIGDWKTWDQGHQGEWKYPQHFTHFALQLSSKSMNIVDSWSNHLHSSLLRKTCDFTLYLTRWWLVCDCTETSF